MSDEIDFFLRVSGPKIDCEDEVRGIDIAVRQGDSAQSCGDCRAHCN